MATPKQATFRHMDLPDPREAFADSIHTVVWDGQALRIEFSVTRIQAPTTANQTEATRYPACRLVLTAPAASDLANRLQQTMTALKGGGQPTAQPGRVDVAPAVQSTTPQTVAIDNPGVASPRNQKER